eukprot:3562954-Pyramimonas_sp.AAC.1
MPMGTLAETKGHHARLWAKPASYDEAFAVGPNLAARRVGDINVAGLEDTVDKPVGRRESIGA